METEHFKQRLEEELRTVESGLAAVGRKNPQMAGGWEATAGGFDANPAEPEEEAQKFQEEENNEAAVKILERRLADIKHALGKIENGTYGICEISDEPIESARLEANPAARTCIAHLEEEKSLPE